ncbi:hypothetical protein Tco_0791807 [Tanacetum coccineum]
MRIRPIEELSPVPPTEGYGEAIVLPEINADHFEIKTNLLQLVHANPFHGLENENPHAHINSFKRITSTLRFRNVPNDVIKLMMFPYSLEGAAKTCEAWERFKGMLRSCPHHGFLELTQVDTFYNGLTENEQDSLNAATGGNLLICKKTSSVRSDTRSQCLIGTDFDSWQQLIRLSLILGKDNGEILLKSIKEGPFFIRNGSDVIVEELRVQFTKVCIPKDIYSLINHYTDAKDIWENVKMILEGSELTKDDRESQLYDEFEHFRQNKGETIQGYYRLGFTKLINDMRNIKMTMPRMQLNSKFVNNMLPEWSRFITEVKLNRGLKESNFDQLYAYLKQHEVHANENIIMMERFIQPNNDPLALVSDASVQQYPTQSSKSPQPSKEPSPGLTTSTGTNGSSSQKNLLKSLSNTLALLTQSYKSHLPQTNNQLRASSNARNKAMVQDGKVVVQDVRGRYNATNQGRPFQRNNARGNGVAGNVGGQNRGGMINPGQSKHSRQDATNASQDEAEQYGCRNRSLFLAGEQVTNVDDDVEVFTLENDMGLNVGTMSFEVMNVMNSTLMLMRYVKNNEEHVVQSNVSSVRNDALMSILDEMHEQGVQSRVANKPDMIVNDSVTSELARYKELERKILVIIRTSFCTITILVLPLTIIVKTERSNIFEKDFKQKEDKFLEEFLDIKKLKDKIEDRLYKQDQSVQTVHMLCKPKSFYDEKHKVAIGYKNPLCLAHAKQAQSVLYSGQALVTTNHAPTVREIAEITRKRMLLKMQSPLCVENKVRIAPPPPDYSKENFLATFAPQRNLTPEQIFWSIDDNNRKKAETSVPKPISALTVYPPNTPVKLVPRILPTKSQVLQRGKGFEQNKKMLLTEVIPFFKTLKEHFVGVQTALFKEVKEMEEIFDQMNNEVNKNTVDKQCAEIEKKNLLIENENLIVNCLSTQLLSHTVQEAPDFNSFFKIKNLEHQIQEKDNVIRHLKDLVANVNDRSCEPYNAKDVTALIEQNDCDRVELEKVKQHYKELYDSIKITRAHTSEKTSTMLNEIESLKAQLRSKESCFTSDYVKPKVLAPGMYVIDVKPIPHPLKNNRSAHLNYISHLKESVETVREIVEEARVVKPLDNALNYACQYTKLSQELLEYVIGTCPKSFNERDNKAPSTPITRKKQVTFSDKPGTSYSNTQKHEVH